MFTLSNDLIFSNFLDTAEPTNYDILWLFFWIINIFITKSRNMNGLFLDIVKSCGSQPVIMIYWTRVKNKDFAQFLTDKIF